MIEKVLHFVWVGDESLRPEGCIDSWRRLNPNYDVVVWGNKEFQETPWLNKRHMADMWEAELCGVADLMRYEILYHCGGIAIDADSLCVRPLEDWMLESEAFACWSNELYQSGMIANGIMGAKAGNPFIAKLIMDVYNQETVVDRRAWISTGPILVTKAWQATQYSLTIWPTHLFLPDFHSGPDYDGTGPVFARQFYGSTYNGMSNQEGNRYSQIRAVAGSSEGRRSGENACAVQQIAGPTELAEEMEESEPARLLVATDWSHAAVPMGCLRMVAAATPSQTPIELVFVVAHEPGQVDAECVQVLLEESGIEPDGFSLRVESRDESAALPYVFAVVPTGDPEVVVDQMAQFGAWVTRLAAGRIREIPRQRRDTLESALGQYRPGYGVPAVPQPAPAELVPPANRVSTYVGGNRLLVQTVWGFPLHVLAQELSITPQLALHGAFEPELAAFLQRVVKPGSKVIDVGANMGVFTTLLGRLVGAAGHVWAYEPIPSNLEVLRDNVMMNWLSPRVTISDRAVSDSVGVITLQTSERWTGLSSTKTVGDAELTTGVIDTDAYLVSAITTTLDEDFAEAGQEITLIKVDVEGAEGRVFAGMRKLLASGRVRCVVFECIGFRLKEDWVPFSEQLRGFAASGWTFATISASGEPRVVDVEVVIQHAYLYHVVMFAPGSVS